MSVYIEDRSLNRVAEVAEAADIYHDAIGDMRLTPIRARFRRQTQLRDLQQ